MIQNLISSSGQQVAMQRAVQLNSYLNPPKLSNVDMPKDVDKKSFAEVLKNSKAQQTDKTGFGTLIKNPAETVKAKILGSAGKFGSLTGLGNISALTTASASTSIPEVSRNAPKAQILAMIDKVAKKHGVDQKLVRALVRQESGFNPNATSHCGAQGLMQLMPATAKGLGVTDAYNTVQNVEGGVKYLKGLLNKYNGNVILALAAYNAGPGAVDKYGNVPPYKETQNYVKSILANYL